MTHDDFYYIMPAITSQNVQCAPYNFKETASAERSSYFKGGEFARYMPNIFVTNGGRNMKDFMYGAIGLNLVSEKLKSELESANVTGVDFIPITIKTAKTRVYSNYFAMLITGRSKKADRKTSEVKFFAENQRVRASWHDMGYFFPIDSWDGSDIFYCEGTMADTCVTQKAYNVLCKYEEKKCIFIDKCSEFVWPGRSVRFNNLEDCFNPDALLKEI